MDSQTPLWGCFSLAESIPCFSGALSRYHDRMKTQPAPNVPGDTDAERMRNALRAVLTVSKTDLLKREAQRKRKRDGKRAKQTGVGGDAA